MGLMPHETGLPKGSYVPFIRWAPQKALFPSLVGMEHLLPIWAHPELGLGKG